MDKTILLPKAQQYKKWKKEVKIANKKQALKTRFINSWLSNNWGFTEDRQADLEEIADWWLEHVK
jgi:hypothetical protein